MILLELEGQNVLYRIPLVFDPQPEGGFTVTSPALPELVTEGDSWDEAYANVQDALAAVIEIYSEDGRDLPEGISQSISAGKITTEAMVEAA